MDGALLFKQKRLLYDTLLDDTLRLPGPVVNQL